MFIKRANGYVIPVELYIKFHYSLDHHYTFLAIINPFHEMSPFANRIKYNISQLLFLLVEDDLEGRVTETSESLPLLLNEQLKMKTKGTLQTSICRRITDVATDLDLTWLRSTRQERHQKGEIYEGVHNLDLL